MSITTIWKAIKNACAWLGKNTWAIIVAVFAVLLAIIRIERKRTEKAQAQTAKIEQQLEHAKIQQKIDTAATGLKDKLVGEQRKNAAVRDEINRDLGNITEEKEKELNEDIKKMAADQSARMRNRADRMSNNK
jgi:flagellar biosynthesis/type III secretory pathway M-ring protein FliF/YscJ